MRVWLIALLVGVAVMVMRGRLAGRLPEHAAEPHLTAE